MFVISILPQFKTEQKFYQLDYSGWGSLQAASKFPTLEAAKAVIDKGQDFHRRNCFTDGTSSPPVAIWSGLDISYATPKARGRISIMEVILNEKFSIEVEDELKG